jgi:hypothetical protein
MIEEEMIIRKKIITRYHHDSKKEELEDFGEKDKRKSKKKETKDHSEIIRRRIVKWNARAREVCKGKHYSRIIITKQGVPKDFWFKPYIGKFNGEKLAKEYVQKQ